MPVVLGLGRGGDRLFEHRHSFGEPVEAIQRVALQYQVLGLLGLGFSEETIEGGQRFAVLVFLQLQLTQHQQDAEVAVVVEAVELQCPLQIRDGRGGVVGFIGDLRGDLRGEGVVVCVGGAVGDDFVGDGAGFGALGCIVLAHHLPELRRDLGGSLGGRRDAGRIGILLDDLCGFLAVVFLAAAGAVLCGAIGGRLRLGLSHRAKREYAGNGGGKHAAAERGLLHHGYLWCCRRILRHGAARGPGALTLTETHGVGTGLREVVICVYPQLGVRPLARACW